MSSFPPVGKDINTDYDSSNGIYIHHIIFSNLLYKLLRSCSIAKVKYQMVRIKQKDVFKHVQNAQILIYTAHAQCLIQAFALHWYIL